ncbi:RlpA-like double-psi beta-barrel-protein domain-containing protein-containing protein [Collybia nuda]|uniref:RlpA-like double-psi beta-barrel-protein domain-containing protein-containing protein n=1 Tax=Collybia nuda TaxID=64659 RepID=A0A9P6C947_9AGAR|nr:RlpA-like double-psi beta-barrel-protein domain-containing protein-containing protein [Collybia nuda]
MKTSSSLVSALGSIFIFGLPTFGGVVPAHGSYSTLLTRASFGGEATYFNVGLGACGKFNIDRDFIVALATPTYAQGSHCDKILQRIRISDPSTGKTAVAVIRDACPGCSPSDIDMSPALFEYFQPLSRGRFNVNWSFV